jgi:hypothetical protein
MVRGHPRRGAERRLVTGNRWQRGRPRAAGGGGVGRPAGPSGLNSEEEFFSNKNWILNLSRLGKFVEGDLGGILT